MTGTNRDSATRAQIAIALIAFTTTVFWALASAAAPYIYVLNRNTEDLSVIDVYNPGVEYAVLDVRWPSLPASDDANPREMILRGDGSELYILADTYVAIVDVETLEEVATWQEVECILFSFLASLNFIKIK